MALQRTLNMIQAELRAYLERLIHRTERGNHESLRLTAVRFVKHV